MTWYYETFNKYNNSYVSDKYYLDILGNTIYIKTKKKHIIVFHINMVNPKFNDNVMEFILTTYGFYKRKEVVENGK